MVDSPGVDESDDFSSSRAQDVTKVCQRNTACGFIYVIDATCAAEVGGQVKKIIFACMV